MPPKSRPALTPRQLAFVNAYVKKPNGAEAARAAGYSEHTAREYAYQLLRRRAVIAEIRRHQELTDLVDGGNDANFVRNGFKVIAERGLNSSASPALVAAAVRSLEQMGKLQALYPREGVDVRVRGEVEAMLEDVRPLMTKPAYAELVRALAQISGVPRVAESPAEGDRSDTTH